MPNDHEQAIDPADWAALWQSELAALAVDPEWHERASAWGQAWLTNADAAAGRAGPDAPPGAASARPPPELERELEALRQRVAELERGPGHT